MKSRKSFLLRIGPELYRELEAWAQQELRSVNGQIEFLLKEAVARRRRLALPSAQPEDPPGPAGEGLPRETNGNADQ
jgi:hypothetical protein